MFKSYKNYPTVDFKQSKTFYMT